RDYQHELAHQWIMFLGFAPLEQGNPHWPLSDLATDPMGFSIPHAGNEGGNFNYILTPSGGNFVLTADPSPRVFSDLSLYLIGLLPSASVKPHFVFNNQAQTPTAGGTLLGPVTNVTIADVISHSGPRVPDASVSPKSFRVATILV